MRQVLLPLLLHKGQLHNWQVGNSVQIQNLGVSSSKTTWCFQWATQERKTSLSSYFSCKQEQICFLWEIILTRCGYWKYPLLKDLLNKETRIPIDRLWCWSLLSMWFTTLCLWCLGQGLTLKSISVVSYHPTSHMCLWGENWVWKEKRMEVEISFGESLPYEKQAVRST